MIVVFGSLNMDLVLTVPSIPRPGETVLCDEYVTKPGGKGCNQAVAAARAGAAVAMIGQVGDDAFGQRLVDVLSAQRVDTTGIAPLRLSLGWSTTDDEIDVALRLIPDAITTIRERRRG